MRFSPGRDGGSVPSAIADGYNQQKTESPGRDDSECREICSRPSGTLVATEETSPVIVVTGIELSSLPGLNRICQTAINTY